MTALLSALGDVPPHLIFLYSLAAVCICALTVAGLHHVYHYYNVYERLCYVKTEPHFVNQNPKENSIDVMFKCFVKNMSLNRSIYISLRRADSRLQGRTNEDPILRDQVIIVPPFAEFSFSTAAIPGIDVSKEIKGKLDVEILYGPKPDDLRHLLVYVIEPILEVKELTETGGRVFFNAPIKKYEHIKN